MAALIRFAHRGAPVYPVAGNTLAAFEAALRRGAEGIESDVRLTADGVPVLLHGGALPGGRSVRHTLSANLPAHVPALADLWERCGSDFQLALDMSDPAAIEAVIALARRHGALSRLWITYWRLPEMAAWRQRWPEARLVYATLLGFPQPVLRRTVARLAAAGVDAINLHHRLVTERSAETAHAAGVRLFAWGLRNRASTQRFITGGTRGAWGVDAIFIDALA